MCAHDVHVPQYPCGMCSLLPHVGPCGPAAVTRHGKHFPSSALHLGWGFKGWGHNSRAAVCVCKALGSPFSTRTRENTGVKSSQAEWLMPPVTEQKSEHRTGGSQRFEASLGHTVSSRLVRAAQRDPISNNQQQQ